MAPSMKALITMLLVASTTAAPIYRRQLAGTGDACSSLLSGTDNSVGYGIENVEENTAAIISGTKGGVPAAPHAPAPPPVKRQLDKIANGAGAIIDATGIPHASELVTGPGDSLDGSLTSGQADAGAKLQDFEESTIEGATKQIP